MALRKMPAELRPAAAKAIACLAQPARSCSISDGGLPQVRANQISQTTRLTKSPMRTHSMTTLTIATWTHQSSRREDDSATSDTPYPWPSRPCARRSVGRPNQRRLRRPQQAPEEEGGTCSRTRFRTKGRNLTASPRMFLTFSSKPSNGTIAEFWILSLQKSDCARQKAVHASTACPAPIDITLLLSYDLLPLIRRPSLIHTPTSSVELILKSQL